MEKEPNPVHQKAMEKAHERERHRHRIYVRSLQHDNEIVFLNKMSDEGFLW